jgi:adenylate cyclase class IV
MPRNIEIKARVDDLASVEARAGAIATHGPEDLLQDDTFFASAHGRLKLRELGDGRGELIHYARKLVSETNLPLGGDGGNSTLTPIFSSEYLISPTTAPGALRESLARAIGITGRVRKRRRLYLVDRTRIHLDRVEGLGTFVELEVVLREGESESSGEAVARGLMDQLGIGGAQLVRAAYVDLAHD